MRTIMWGLMSRFWFRAFASFLYYFIGLFLSFGVIALLCGGMGYVFYIMETGIYDFPFFRVFVVCVVCIALIALILALPMVVEFENIFCETCIEVLKKDFLEGIVSERDFKYYYNRLKPLRAKWEQRERLKERKARIKKEKEEAMRKEEEEKNKRLCEEKQRREIFLEKFQW